MNIVAPSLNSANNSQPVITVIDEIVCDEGYNYKNDECSKHCRAPKAMTVSVSN